MIVAFRADSSFEIGAGHIMRCLALANAFAKLGANCHFICSANPGALHNAVRDHGHFLHVLPVPSGHAYGHHPAPPKHKAWLGRGWREDAAQTKSILQLIDANLLVVDHYSLDIEWEKAAHGDHMKIAVIDDLADRSHSADFLIDQNFGRSVADYASLMVGASRLFIGPEFALLREEFSEERPAALKRRELANLNRLLVNVGGIDSVGLTPKIIKTLGQINLNTISSITAVVGASSKFGDETIEVAKTVDTPVEVIIGAKNMAKIMKESDICIGAGGSTTWERCVLGLPTLMISVAENQSKLVADMSMRNLCYALPQPTEKSFASECERALGLFSSASFYRAAAKSCAELTNGFGAIKIAAAITQMG